MLTTGRLTEWRAGEVGPRGDRAEPGSPVGQQKACQCLGEIGVFKQRSNLRGDVAAHFGVRGSNVVRYLRPPIDYRDDVFQVVACPDVIAAASMKGFQLGRDEKCRRDHSDVMSCDVE